MSNVESQMPPLTLSECLFLSLMWCIYRTQVGSRDDATIQMENAIFSSLREMLRDYSYLRTWMGTWPSSSKESPIACVCVRSLRLTEQGAVWQVSPRSTGGKLICPKCSTGSAPCTSSSTTTRTTRLVLLSIGLGLIFGVALAPALSGLYSLIAQYL